MMETEEQLKSRDDQDEQPTDIEEGVRPRNGEGRPKPKRRVRTIADLRRRAKSRRYSAAALKRGKRTRAERQRHFWEMGVTPPTPDEQAKIAQALDAGALVMRAPWTEHEWRIRNLWYRACKARDWPAVVVTTHGTTADICVDLTTYRPGRRGQQFGRGRQFTDEAIAEANQLAIDLFRATASHRGRRWERDEAGERSTAIGSCGTDLATLDNVPLERVADLTRALLALPMIEMFPNGGWTVYNARCDVPDD